MYLLIFEDISLSYKKEISINDYDAADNGILDIVDISGEFPLVYSYGKWRKIEEYGTEYYSGN